MNPPYELSLVIPVYNEEEVLLHILQHNTTLLSQSNFSSEIILVNDASTDSSESIIFDFIKHNLSSVSFSYLRNGKNEGFGGAVGNGINAAKGTNILCLPADICISHYQLDAILRCLLANEVVACYRTEKPGNSFMSKIGSHLYQFWVKSAFRLHVRDMNWIHAYQRKIFSEGGIVLRNKGFFFLAEVLIKAQWKGFRIGELLLNPQERTNRKGASQSFYSFFIAMKDSLKFWLRTTIKGKMGDL